MPHSQPHARPAMTLSESLGSAHARSVSDGMSMGTDGMSFSLQSRDIISDSIETVMSAQWYDANVSLPGDAHVRPLTSLHTTPSMAAASPAADGGLSRMAVVAWGPICTFFGRRLLAESNLR